MSYIQETLESYKKQNPNSDFLAKLASFELPTIKNEDWKYTNASRFFKNALPIPPGNENLNELTGFALVQDQSFHPGAFSKTLRKSSDAEIKGFFNSDLYFKEGFLNLLVSAAPTLFITLEDSKNEIVKLKIINTKEVQSHIVLLGSNLKNTKIFIEIEGSGHINFHQNLNLDQNCFLEQSIVQKMDDTAIFTFENHSTIERDAHFMQVLAMQGGQLSRGNVSAKLNGENAVCDLHGLMTPKNTSHFDLCGHIEHAAPHTYSKQVYKSVIDDKAKAIFNGKVKVNRNSFLIEAEQLNKNLLLSKTAQAFSRPQMEIDADDVKCAHGSTTGQLSEQELFYFESRGIRKEKARKMLAKGFSNDVILKLKTKELIRLTQEGLI